MTNTVEVQKTKKRKKVASLEKKKARAGWIFVLPFVIGFVIVYFPIVFESITKPMMNGRTNTQPARAFLFSREAAFFFFLVFFTSTVLVISTSPFSLYFDIAVSRYRIENSVDLNLNSKIVKVQNKGLTVRILLVNYC